MHKTSLKYMKDCFARHTADMPKGRVLDVGSFGRRAHFREIWEGGGWEYVGCDMDTGANVDVVLEDPWQFPFEDGSFDAVISGQMLEHNEMFWLTFLEMERVLRVDGLMIHIAPSRGHEHRAPQDCWRFYRDGMEALAKWSGLTCVETTTDWAPEHLSYWKERRRSVFRRLKGTMRTRGTNWGDTVGVFRKTASPDANLAAHYLPGFAKRYAQHAPAQAAE